MLGPPPETTQDRVQTKDTHPVPEKILKFLIPPETKPGRRAGSEYSADHATATRLNYVPGHSVSNDNIVTVIH